MNLNRYQRTVADTALRCLGTGSDVDPDTLARHVVVAETLTLLLWAIGDLHSRSECLAGTQRRGILEGHDPSVAVAFVTAISACRLEAVVRLRRELCALLIDPAVDLPFVRARLTEADDALATFTSLCACPAGVQ